MRTLALLLALVCVALATPTPTPTYHHNVVSYTVEDKAFLEKQRDILRLFKYVNQESYYQDHIDIAKSWTFENHVDSYTNATVVKHFLHWWNKGGEDFIQRGEVFSIFNPWHLKQAIALFDLFYYAKDYDTFYKTAVWARQHMNQGMFLYTFSVALVHRTDTKGIILPPIYEVYPYYFFTSDVLHKAAAKKMHYGGVTHDTTDFRGYIIPANYTGYYTHNNPEQELSYYTEDVGVNAFYYYYNLYYPFWMNSKQYHFRHEFRGELYFYVHQQILARYYMERLSHHEGSIDWFDYNDFFEHGYYPMMHYPNGVDFPARPEHAYMYHHKFYNGHNFDGDHTYWKVVEMEDYERRIRDAIDHGYIYTEEGKKVDLYEEHGFDILGNLIQNNGDTMNGKFYGALEMFARQFLGYGYKPFTYHRSAPSVLEHFETSLRDPAFYMFYKRIFTYFMKYKEHLPHYKYSDLVFKGVKIEKMHIDKLYTYFDWFNVDISNGLVMNKHEFETDGFPVYARVERLNHKPFVYTATVSSTEATPVVIRTYLGPKYDEFGHTLWLDDNRMNYLELDSFVYDLKVGTNTIERSSRMFPGYGVDRTTFKTLYKRVMGALKGDEKFVIDGSETFWSYPNRMLLPRGTHGGMTFQLYMFISPYTPTSDTVKSVEYPYGKAHYNTWTRIDAHPYMYPLDRPIVEHDFHVPNSYFADVTIYHRTAEEMNKSTHEVTH